MNVRPVTFNVPRKLISWLSAGVATGLLASSCLAAADPSLDCYSALAARSDLSDIKDKVGLSGVQDQTFRMLANTDYVSPADKQIIARWADLTNECFKAGLKFRQNYPSFALRALEQFRSSTENASLDLYEGKLTYGEFAKRRKEIAAVFGANVIEIQRLVKEQAAGVEAAKAQAEVQASERSAEQRAENCQSARFKMAALCNANVDRSNGVTINIGRANPFYVEPVDIIGTLECQKSKNEVVRLCQ